MLDIPPYTRTHQSTVVEKPGFSSSLCLIRHHICVSERLLVIDSPLRALHQAPRCILVIAIIALIPSLRCSAVSMATMAENITQNDSANGGGRCLGGCIIGVSGAGSLCVHALVLCMYVGGNCECMHAFMHSQLHTRMHSHVSLSEGHSLHNSVRDCEIHLFLIRENVAS